VYDEYFDFVWRVVRRLGVRDGSVDDVVQDIFVIVHRQLPGFEGRSSLKTWLFGITRRVVRDQLRRSAERAVHDPLTEGTLTDSGEGPFDAASRSEATRVLHALLDELDEAKREAFVLAELEQMTAPEMAEALGLNLNTVYARIRAARQAFELAVTRFQARKQGGSHE
jgi:RNA polymerase sigma-70 factor (ECF subfamily)